MKNGENKMIEIEAGSINTQKYLNENKKVEICMLDKNFKQKMKYANRLNVPYVIIVGENEKNNNEYVLKNMYDGSQKIIKL